MAPLAARPRWKAQESAQRSRSAEACSSDGLLTPDRRLTCQYEMARQRALMVMLFIKSDIRVLMERSRREPPRPHARLLLGGVMVSQIRPENRYRPPPMTPMPPVNVVHGPRHCQPYASRPGVRQPVRWPPWDKAGPTWVWFALARIGHCRSRARAPCPTPHPDPLKANVFAGRQPLCCTSATAC